MIDRLVTDLPEAGFADQGDSFAALHSQVQFTHSRDIAATDDERRSSGR
jgi:hypothetical protein